MRYLNFKHCGTGKVYRMTVQGEDADLTGVAEDGSIIERLQVDDIKAIEEMPPDTPYTVEFRPEAPENNA